LSSLAPFIRSPLDVLTFEQPARLASSFRFFSNGAVRFQKFLGGEFLSCAGLLESKHIGPFPLVYQVTEDAGIVILSASDEVRYWDSGGLYRRCPKNLSLDYFN